MSAPIESSAEPTEDAGAELERRAQAILKLEAIVSDWDESARLTVQALKSGIEDLNREALKRLIRALKDDPASGSRLRSALADELVYGVLLFHGLVKEPLQARLQKALEEVRPLMHGHGGDIELVAIKPPDTVEIRLVGSCHGCPASGETLSQGVEKSIREHCPEILHVLQVSRAASEVRADGESVVHFISPFALNAKAGWIDAASLEEIREHAVIERRIKGRSVLLSRRGDQVSCFDNSCAHLGMPLEMAEISEGVITCSYHGFRYLLETGECLTAPEVQLKVHAVRVLANRVQVRLEE